MVQTDEEIVEEQDNTELSAEVLNLACDYLVEMGEDENDDEWEDNDDDAMWDDDDDDDNDIIWDDNELDADPWQSQPSIINF